MNDRDRHIAKGLQALVKRYDRESVEQVWSAVFKSAPGRPKGAEGRNSLRAKVIKLRREMPLEDAIKRSLDEKPYGEFSEARIQAENALYRGGISGHGAHARGARRMCAAWRPS